MQGKERKAENEKGMIEEKERNSMIRGRPLPGTLLNRSLTGLHRSWCIFIRSTEK